jgi:catechol 2,3-dioxygenase-like lactoylglutathione lyase family enzyme
MATVRYIVDDLDAAIGFYGDLLGFEVVMRPADTFAMLSRGDLRLLLSVPSSEGGGGQSVGDRAPEPGGWNRFVLDVDDVKAEIERLREAGVSFRSDLIIGVGGDQVQIEDPAGNPVELFQQKSG